MEWNLDFISKEDFKEHVKSTITKYGERLESYDLEKFNKNLVDPIKLLFDKSVYGASWSEIINNEIFRQRDKSNNNAIGYFYQNIFSYFDGCEVPQSGWDVIYTNPNGIQLPDGDIVHTLYVEMKNKHNTMNSSSSAKTYIKMQSQILDNDDCACLLVEAIAKKSQNIKWATSVDNKRVQHRLIRRVSMDQFYYLLTNDKYAFYKMCMILPSIIDEVIHEKDNLKIPEDIVYEALTNIADLFKDTPEDLSLTIATYMLGFNTYDGFSEKLEEAFNDSNCTLKRLYTYTNYIYK